MLNKPARVDITLHKIYSTDGFELDSILFEPKKKTKKIIIHVHGKEGHFIQNHFVTYMGYSYPLAGYSFLTFNNRGHDYVADMLKKSANGFEWVTRGAAYEAIEEINYELDGVIDYVKELGYDEIVLQGHSLGPIKLSYYLAHNPKHTIARAIFMSTSDILHLLNVNLPAWQEAREVAQKMIKENRDMELTSYKLWSNALVSAKTLWHYTKPDSDAWVFNFSNPHLEFKYFNTISIPLVVINPENDFTIGGISTKKANEMLHERTISTSFTSYIIANAPHNYASQENVLIKKIVTWLKKFK